MSNFLCGDAPSDFVDTSLETERRTVHFEPEWTPEGFGTDNELTPGYAFGTRTTKNYIGVYSTPVKRTSTRKYTALFCAELARDVQNQTMDEMESNNRFIQFNPFTRGEYEKVDFRPSLIDTSYSNNEKEEINFPTQLPIKAKRKRVKPRRRKVVKRRERERPVRVEEDTSNKNDGKRKDIESKGKETVINIDGEKDDNIVPGDGKSEKENTQEGTGKKKNKEEKGEEVKSKKQEKKKRRRSTRTRGATEKRKRVKRTLDSESVQEKKKENK